MTSLIDMTINELQAHIAEAQDVLASKTSDRRAELLAELEALGGADIKLSKPRTPAKPKYKSKKDGSKTWVGRGQQPLWMREEIAEGLGASKEDFFIQPA